MIAQTYDPRKMEFTDNQLKQPSTVMENGAIHAVVEGSSRVRVVGEEQPALAIEVREPTEAEGTVPPTFHSYGKVSSSNVIRGCIGDQKPDVAFAT